MMQQPKTGQDLIVEQCFTPEQCDEIINFGGNWIEGTVQKFNAQLTDKQHRSVLLSKDNLPEDFIESLYFKILQINNRTFRYHLEGFVIHDLPRIFKYSADRKDHYVWHRDTLLRPELGTCRKLSFSIQLSNSADYDGGDLEFLPEQKNPLQRQQGSIILFPSYLTHRVSPITRGTRHVIVGWIYGPYFK